MPTSSQALILNTCNGELPPLFQRNTWQPDTSFQHLPPSCVNQNKRPAKIPSTSRTLTELFPIRRTGSEPNVRIKHDLSTLTDLLQIKRLGASGTLDNPLLFHAAATRRPRELAPIRRNKYFDREVNAYGNGGWYVEQKLFIPDFRHPVDRNKERQKGPGSDNNLPHVFVRSKTTGDGVTFETTSSEEAEYFRLFEAEPPQITTGSAPHSPMGTVFKLERTTAREPGSFRIAPIENDGHIQFCLVPPSGCESDIYRLQPVLSDTPNSFKLLQRDPYEDDLFRTVETNWSETERMAEDNEMFQRLNHVDSFTDDQERQVVQLRRNMTVSTDWSDKHMEPQNSTIHQYTNHGHSSTDDQGRQGVKLRRNRTDPSAGKHLLQAHRDVMYRSAENIASNFNELPPIPNAQESLKTNPTLPDPTWTDYITQSSLHKPDEVITAVADIPDSLEADGEATDDKRTSNVMSSIRNQSTHVYERLVTLGFRRTEQDPDKVIFYEGIRQRVADKDRQKYYSSDWKTHFDQYGRVTENMSDGTFSSLDQSSFLSQMIPGQTPLLNGMNTKESNNFLKKKKIKAPRMRKESPPKDPNAVCISLRDNVITHGELKRKIEKEAGVKLISLQFDPVAVQCEDPEVRSQWIIRFSSRVICEYLTKCGLSLDGVHYSIKSFDDVMQREHNAYRYFTAFSNAKLTKNTGHKSKRNKHQMTGQTQTGGFPQLKQVAVV